MPGLPTKSTPMHTYTHIYIYTYIHTRIYMHTYMHAYIHGRRPGAEFGGTNKIFRGPISGKISIFRVKISDDLFFSHRLGSSDFPFLFSHFPYVYYVKCRI